MPVLLSLFFVCFFLFPLPVFHKYGKIGFLKLVLSDILQQLVNFCHQLTGIHEFMFAITEVVEHIVKIIFFVVLRDLLHGRQPFGRRLRARVSPQSGPVVGRVLEVCAGCPGCHPWWIICSLGWHVSLPALQRVGAIHLVAFRVGIQRGRQQALEDAAHFGQEGGGAGVPRLLLALAVLPKRGKALLLLPSISCLGILLETLVVLLLLQVLLGGLEFLPWNEHVAPVVGGGRGQRGHPALVGVAQDPALLRAQAHGCKRDTRRVSIPSCCTQRLHPQGFLPPGLNFPRDVQIWCLVSPSACRKVANTNDIWYLVPPWPRMRTTNVVHVRQQCNPLKRKKFLPPSTSLSFREVFHMQLLRHIRAIKLE